MSASILVRKISVFFVFFYKSHTDVGKTTNVNGLDQFNTDFLPLFFFEHVVHALIMKKKLHFVVFFFLLCTQWNQLLPNLFAQAKT